MDNQTARTNWLIFLEGTYRQKNKIFFSNFNLSFISRAKPGTVANCL